MARSLLGYTVLDCPPPARKESKRVPALLEDAMPDPQPEAVVLDFVQPAIGSRRAIDAGRQAGLYKCMERLRGDSNATSRCASCQTYVIVAHVSRTQQYKAIMDRRPIASDFEALSPPYHPARLISEMRTGKLE